MRIVTARNAADLLGPLFAGAAEEGVAALHFGREGALLAIDAAKAPRPSQKLRMLLSSPNPNARRLISLRLTPQ